MPDTPKHPVTVLGNLLTIGADRIRRPATVADLVLALRAEGVLVVEPSVRNNWPEWALVALGNAMNRIEQTTRRGLDALAEVQPFPPAGE